MSSSEKLFNSASSNNMEEERRLGEALAKAKNENANLVRKQNNFNSDLQKKGNILKDYCIELIF